MDELTRRPPSPPFAASLTEEPIDNDDEQIVLTRRQLYNLIKEAVAQSRMTSQMEGDFVQNTNGLVLTFRSGKVICRGFAHDRQVISETVFCVNHDGTWWYYIFTNGTYQILKYGGKQMKAKRTDTRGGPLEGRFSQSNGNELDISTTHVSYGGQSYARVDVSPTVFYSKYEDDYWYYCYTGEYYHIFKYIGHSGVITAKRL